MVEHHTQAHTHIYIHTYIHTCCVPIYIYIYVIIYHIMFRYRSYDYWLNLPTRQSLATCAEIIVALEDRSAEWHRALLGGADPSRSLGDDQVTSPGRDPAMVGRGMRKSHGENGKTHGIHGKMIYKCWVNFEKWSRLQEGSWLVMGQKNT